MRYLTAIEAAKRIGVAEKTVRLWVKEGKLEALHPAKNRLAIAEEDVERIAQERRMYYHTQPETPSSNLTHPDVSALEHRVEVLEQKVADLQEALNMLARPYIPSHVQTPPLQATEKPHTLYRYATDKQQDTQPPQEPRNRNVARNKALPDGCILCSDFAKQHGIPRETMRDYLLLGIGRGTVPGELPDPVLGTKEQIDYSERAKPGRAKETERYFTPQQAEQALEVLKRHGKIKEASD